MLCGWAHGISHILGGTAWAAPQVLPTGHSTGPSACTCKNFPWQLEARSLWKPPVVHQRSPLSQAGGAVRTQGKERETGSRLQGPWQPIWEYFVRSWGR